VVYKDKSVPCEFFPDGEGQFRRTFDRWGDPDRKNGLFNDYLGEAQRLGMFCAFSWQTACDLVSLILRNAYVAFGQKVFRQVTGIPMGVNPGVFVANYYLFAYEFDFVKQLVDLLLKYPPGGGNLHPEFARGSLFVSDPAQVLSRLQGEIGDAALFVLLQFKFMCRYVDDVLSGPNQCLDALLYNNLTLLGGLIRGLYPAYLHLTDSNPRPMEIDVSTDHRSQVL